MDQNNQTNRPERVPAKNCKARTYTGTYSKVNCFFTLILSFKPIVMTALGKRTDQGPVVILIDGKGNGYVEQKNGAERNVYRY